MSTKTTFKRVALVTVAALGFGLLSTAPSSAASAADSLVLSSATASQLTGETATASSASVTLTYLAQLATDSMSVSVSLVSAPAGNTVFPRILLTETATSVATLAIAAAGAASTPMVNNATSGTAANTTVFVLPSDAAVNASAKFSVYMDAPVKVGTYVVKVTPAVTGGGGALAATAQTVTITVTQNPASDTVATSATSILNKAETISATSDATVTSSKTVSTSAAAATIAVTLLNASGVETAGESYTATITGSGTLGSGNTWTTTTAHSTAATGRAITVKAGDHVAIFPDGSSGVGTVTISSALGVILATEKVTFYGAVTTIKTTVVKSVIAPVAGITGALLVTAQDVAGTEVQNASLNTVSSAATIISNAYVACGSYSATNGTVGAGYLCTLNGVKAGTANITVTTNASASDTTGVSATAVSVRVGSNKPASVSVAFDKASYVPGEKATISVTLLDSTGLIVADGVYTDIFAAGGLEADYSWSGGLSDTLTATSVTTASGIKTYTVYMPVSEGTVELTGTTGAVDSGVGTGLATANQDADISVKATVASGSTAAATDAANEATDAANAATDAANAAAEAADAATAAAQDAADAVAALSTEVATLIAALKKQITSLTNLVIKIQKKVKA
jgi:hypothetical protein